MTDTKIYSAFSARMLAAKLTKKTGVEHASVAVGEDQYVIQVVVPEVAAKRTNITLHINTGVKREDGKNKQTHVILWNHSGDLNQFFGGAAAVAEGKLSIVTEKLEGEEFPQVADPYALFVNRAKTTGRIMSLAIMQDKNQVGEIKFKKTIAGKVMLSGTYNPRGLQFDDKFHVISEENNRAIFGEVKGGLKEEILASMISTGSKAKPAANDEAALATA